LAIGAKRGFEEWQPDDDEFWERGGKSVARRNITFSIFAEFLLLCVVLWSVTAVSLNQGSFHFSTAQLFTLVALPTLMGATLRVPYTFAWPASAAGTGPRQPLLLLIPGRLPLMVANPHTLLLGPMLEASASRQLWPRARGPVRRVGIGDIRGQHPAGSGGAGADGGPVPAAEAGHGERVGTRNVAP